MTFITDRLEELVEEAKYTERNQKYADYDAQIIHENYNAGYMSGLLDAISTVQEAEKELEKRVWQAWVNEGVEPR